MEESIQNDRADCSALLPRGAPLWLAHWSGAFRWRWAGLWATCAGSLCTVLVFRRHLGLASRQRAGPWNVAETKVSFKPVMPGLLSWGLLPLKISWVESMWGVATRATTGLDDFGALNTSPLYIYIPHALCQLFHYSWAKCRCGNLESSWWEVQVCTSISCARRSCAGMLWLARRIVLHPFALWHHPETETQVQFLGHWIIGSNNSYLEPMERKFNV